MLAAARGLDRSDILYGQPRQRCYLMLQHRVAMARV